MSRSTTALQITTSQLDEMLERRDPFFLLDVRSDVDFKRSPVEARYPFDMMNIPYFAFVEDGEAQMSRVPNEKPIVTLCATGNSSSYVAQLLREKGYSVSNLTGGMRSWNGYCRLRTIPTGKSSLVIYQLSRVARGDLSYVVRSGDEALVIDPTRSVERIIELAKDEGFRILAVLDTHMHADHISGGVALGEAARVPYYLHPYDAIHPLDLVPARIAYERLWDGFSIPFGDCTLKAWHIPGHTLGNMAFLVNDRYLFAGDSIFINSISRPDLGGHTEEWANLQYDSIFGRLLRLPDDTIVLPGHFSMQNEAELDGGFYQSLGKLRQTNPSLQFTTREEFTRFVKSNLPKFPLEYAQIKRVNLGLAHISAEDADELESGKNICALHQRVDS